MKLDFDPGFDITPLSVDEGFRLGADCFDKGTEFRKLDSVRKSLRDPNCDGPENVYAIMMDVGRKKDWPAMQQRMLLYGVVTYAAGIGEAVERSGRALDDFDAGEALRVDRVVLADAIAKAPVLHEAAEEKSVVGLLDEIVGVDVGAAVDEGCVIALQLDLRSDAQIVGEIFGEHLNVQGDILDRGVGAGAGDGVRGTIALVLAVRDGERRELNYLVRWGRIESRCRLRGLGLCRQ